MKQIVFNNKVDYIVQLIDIYAAVFIKDTSLWLADQEKQFLAMMILANSEGIDIDGGEAINYAKSLGFEGNPYMYKKKVQKKKWIVKTEHGSFLPPTFDYKGNDFKEQMIFKFAIIYQNGMGREVDQHSETNSGEESAKSSSGKESRRVVSESHEKTYAEQRNA